MSDAENPLLLLVDDEPAQRRLTIAMASRAGWRTITASIAEEALALLATGEGARLSAVITEDGPQGLEAAALIGEIGGGRPQLSVWC